MRIQLLLVLSLILLPVQFAIGEERAFALLKAALEARRVPSNCVLQFTVTNKFKPDNPASGGLFGRPAQCELLFFNDRRMTTVQTEAEWEVAWFDGQYGWTWSDGLHVDLARRSRKNLDDLGRLYFDPTSFGIDLMNSAQFDHHVYLKADKYTLEQPQEVNGVTCQVVLATRNPKTLAAPETRFFIEEPKLRIHKVTCIGEVPKLKKSYNEEIISMFTTEKKDLQWLPDSVIVRSPALRDWTISDIKVVKRELSQEDFSIKAVGIPIGTAVIDYDQQRRLGYWTGSEIDENFVYTGQPASHWGWLWWVSLAVGLGAVTYLGFAWFKRR